MKNYMILKNKIYDFNMKICDLDVKKRQGKIIFWCENVFWYEKYHFHMKMYDFDM